MIPNMMDVPLVRPSTTPSNAATLENDATRTTNCDGDDFTPASSSSSAPKSRERRLDDADSMTAVVCSVTRVSSETCSVPGATRRSRATRGGDGATVKNTKHQGSEQADGQSGDEHHGVHRISPSISR